MRSDLTWWFLLSELTAVEHSVVVRFLGLVLGPVGLLCIVVAPYSRHVSSWPTDMLKIEHVFQFAFGPQSKPTSLTSFPMTLLRHRQPVTTVRLDNVRNINCSAAFLRQTYSHTPFFFLLSLLSNFPLCVIKLCKSAGGERGCQQQ